MTSAQFVFPKGFLWGTSLSAYQTEGDNSNCNWSDWQKEPGKIQNGDQIGNGCSWKKGKWQEDLDRAEKMNQNCIRISFEWSSIQPQPDKWDEERIDFYQDIIHGIIARGMRPIATLHQFTDPNWFTEMGGWKNSDAPAIFAEYAKKMAQSFRLIVKDWITIDSPNLYASNGWFSGNFPPGKIHSFSQTFKVLTNLAKAHTAAYEIIHHEIPDARAGFAISYQGCFPSKKNIIDSSLASIYNKNYNNAFPKAFITGRFSFFLHTKKLSEIKNAMDFIGLNYFTAKQISFSNGRVNLTFSQDAIVSESGQIANEPDSFFEALKWASNFGVPVLVTKNGIDDHADYRRLIYLADHIHALWKATNSGFPIIGYLHWTLLDLFEWDWGWSKGFGLYSFNPQTGIREK